MDKRLGQIFLAHPVRAESPEDFQLVTLSLIFATITFSRR